MDMVLGIGILTVGIVIGVFIGGLSVGYSYEKEKNNDCK